MEYILQPWPWYVTGPLIGLTMFILLLVGKNFGMSSNLRTLCTICGAGKKSELFRFNWKEQRWNLIVVVGTIAGGFIGAHLLSDGTAVDINPRTIAELKSLGFQSAGAAYLPEELFAPGALFHLKSLPLLVAGGFLIGFGARYAGGCTSGHAISGLSNLQFPSLLAVIGFFLGGMLMIYLLFPLIF